MLKIRKSLVKRYFLYNKKMSKIDIFKIELYSEYSIYNELQIIQIHDHIL